nr:DNA-processing protein DprA [Methanofastidiosum sp.]
IATVHIYGNYQKINNTGIALYSVIVSNNGKMIAEKCDVIPPQYNITSQIACELYAALKAINIAYSHGFKGVRYFVSNINVMRTLSKNAVNDKLTNKVIDSIRSEVKRLGLVTRFNYIESSNITANGCNSVIDPFGQMVVDRCHRMFESLKKTNIQHPATIGKSGSGTTSGATTVNKSTINSVAKKEVPSSGTMSSSTVNAGEVAIFTDGSNINLSAFESKVTYAYVVIKDNNIIAENSGVVPKEEAKGANVAGELAAVLHALEKVAELGFHNIDYYYDYEGIKKWLTHEWKNEQPSTAWYMDKIRDVISKNGLNLIYHHVKSHSMTVSEKDRIDHPQEYWNDYVDKACKKAVEGPKKSGSGTTSGATSVNVSNENSVVKKPVPSSGTMSSSTVNAGEVAIFTDGSNINLSAFESKVTYAYVVIKDNNIIAENSGVVPKEEAKGANVAGELAAVLHALEKVAELGFHNIDYYYDYEGIKKWLTHEWKNEQPSTAWYMDKIRDVISKNGLNLIYHHVKSHSMTVSEKDRIDHPQEYWNDYVDKACKKAAEESNNTCVTPAHKEKDQDNNIVENPSTSENKDVNTKTTSSNEVVKKNDKDVKIGDIPEAEIATVHIYGNYQKIYNKGISLYSVIISNKDKIITEHCDIIPPQYNITDQKVCELYAALKSVDVVYNYGFKYIRFVSTFKSVNSMLSDKTISDKMTIKVIDSLKSKFHELGMRGLFKYYENNLITVPGSKPKRDHLRTKVIDNCCKEFSKYINDLEKHQSTITSSNKSGNGTISGATSVNVSNENSVVKKPVPSSGNNVSNKKEKDQGLMVIRPDNPSYPKKLLDKKYAPSLYCKGNSNLLNAKSVAIVGSRNASEEGLKLAKGIAKALATRGINIVSGYAKGIDTNAHLGALEANGTTTMVLSSGIMGFYRKTEFSDISDWDERTLLVSQFEPNANWSGQNAMIRNRTVCSLANAVIVIESGLERDQNGKMSGSFNAAKTALEMNIPVFVISPTFFKNPPPGNSEIIKRGGIEIDPKGKILDMILKHIKDT